MVDDIRAWVHRKLKYRLASLGLWIETDLYREVAATQWALGDDLRRLIHPLSEKEGEPSPGETLSGPFRQQPNARPPIALSFGYAMSSGFHSFLAGPEPAANAAILGAIFNLGITMFDHACDNRPEARDRLFHLFNEALLRRLMSEPGAHLELANLAGTVSSARLRILFETIVCFFARLDAFARATRDSDVWEKLNELILKAYRAQIQCAQAQGTGIDAKALLLAAHAKSTLPFHIILQLIRVCENCDYGARERSVEQLVRNVARSFWLIDDLMDLGLDFRTGDANAIFLRAGTLPTTVYRECASNATAILAYEPSVDNAVDEVCENLRVAVNTVAYSAVRSNRVHLFSQVLLAYVRIWIE